ncbi:MAG: DUF3488 domain-containing protein [Myxococcales bacterium]|nr:DUF3488 domain-containing protein [Myxococcales bacterium]
MTFRALHKSMTYFVAGLGLYALSLGGGLSTGFVILMAVAFVGSYFVESPRIDSPSYARIWTMAVVGFLSLQVLRALAGAAILPLALEFVALLQISRLFNRRTGRDYYQIAVLCFLHLLVATVLTTSVFYGIVFIGFLVASPWMLTTTHLRREIEESPSHGAPERERIFRDRSLIGSRFLWTTVGLTAPIFVVTAGLFLFFPRVGFGFAQLGLSQGQPTTGFGKNVQLGGFGTIREDPTVVARVTVPRSVRIPKGQAFLHLRGTSFDYYDGVSWTRTATHGKQIRPIENYYPVRRLPDPRRDHEYQIVIEQLDEQVLFLPQDTVALEVPPRVHRNRAVRRRLLRSTGLEIRYLDPDEKGFRYSAYVSPQAGEGGDTHIGPADLAKYLQVPAGADRIRSMAQKIVAGAEGDEERAMRLLYVLKESGAYTYSLALPRTNGKNPLNVFLFEAKRGHCEYFSTALAIMLRSIGIPSRNVTGFAGGEYNPYGDYYAIRQADAHSWLEAYFGGRWVTLDPTPPARNDIGPSGGVIATLRAMADAVKTRWSKHVVGFDLRTQTDALRKLRHYFRRFQSKTNDATRPRPARGSNSAAPWARWLLPIVPIAVLAFLVWWIRRGSRKARKAAAIEPKARRAVDLYRALEGALARRGRPRPPTVTPREHADILLAEGFVGAEIVDEVTDRYLRARFGADWLDAREEARLRQGIRRLRAGPGGKTSGSSPFRA